MGLFDRLFNKKVPKKVEKQIDFTTESNKISGIEFGFKCSWFAIKSNDIEKVWNELKSDFDVKSITNFKSGLEYGYNGGYSLIKPINNWCLLICAYGEPYLEKIKSKNFEEVHFYSTHRSSDFVHITKIVNKIVERDFSTSDGEVLKSEGEPTDIEKIIGEKGRKYILEGERDEEMIKYNTERNFEEFLGDEEGLLKIAENWSINPGKLNEITIDDFALELVIKNIT